MNGIAVFQWELIKFIQKQALRDTFPYLDNITVAVRNQAKQHSTTAVVMDRLKDTIVSSGSTAGPGDAVDQSI